MKNEPSCDRGGGNACQNGTQKPPDALKREGNERCGNSLRYFPKNRLEDCIRGVECSSFVIVGFWLLLSPRAGGCQTALAGARLCARMFFRAYLALHPPARLWFFGVFPCFVRCLIASAPVLCSRVFLYATVDRQIVCVDSATSLWTHVGTCSSTSSFSHD